MRARRQAVYSIIARELGNTVVITLPKPVREELGIEPGDEVLVMARDDRIIVMKKEQ